MLPLAVTDGAEMPLPKRPIWGILQYKKARDDRAFSFQRVDFKRDDPDGIRTRVAAVKGPCPRPLDDGAIENRGKCVALPRRRNDMRRGAARQMRAIHHGAFATSRTGRFPRRSRSAGRSMAKVRKVAMASATSIAAPMARFVFQCRCSAQRMTT